MCTKPGGLRRSGVQRLGRRFLQTCPGGLPTTPASSRVAASTAVLAASRAAFASCPWTPLPSRSGKKPTPTCWDCWKQSAPPYHRAGLPSLPPGPSASPLPFLRRTPPQFPALAPPTAVPECRDGDSMKGTQCLFRVGLERAVCPGVQVSRSQAGDDLGGNPWLQSLAG